MYKTLLAMFLILAACADIPDVDETDEEIDSVEQAVQCVTPGCRVLPHRIYIGPHGVGCTSTGCPWQWSQNFEDYGQVDGGVNGNRNNVLIYNYSGGGDGNRKWYFLNNIQVESRGVFTSCVLTGPTTGTCVDSAPTPDVIKNFTCPAASALVIDESKFGMWCGDMRPGPAYQPCQGALQPNGTLGPADYKKEWAYGSFPLVNKWEMVPGLPPEHPNLMPGAAWFTGASIRTNAFQNTKSIVCNYMPHWQRVVIDALGPP